MMVFVAVVYVAVTIIQVDTIHHSHYYYNFSGTSNSHSSRWEILVSSDPAASFMMQGDSLHPRAFQYFDEKLGLRPLPNYRTPKGELKVQIPDKLPEVEASGEVRSESDDALVSLVTQMTFNKWDRFVALAERWDGPISCAILIRKHEESQLQALIAANGVPAKVTLHVMLALDSTSPAITGEYPINRMRNFALDYATTELVLPIDVDFMPSKHLYPYIHSLLMPKTIDSAVDWGDRLRHHHELLVLPAFERFVPQVGANATYSEGVTVHDLPATKDELRVSLARNESAPFHVKNFIWGHGPTNYEKWYNSDQIYPVKWMPQYEPYFVGARRDLPAYWDGFVGFGYNKLSWITELHAAGYKFVVDPNHFVIHLNHIYENNMDKTQQEVKRAATWEMTQEYFLRFGLYLKEKYHCSMWILRRDFFTFVYRRPPLIHLLLLF
jgi:Glycosyl-transferase for dystroglycan